MSDDSGDLDARKLSKLFILLYRVIALLFSKYSEADSSHSGVKTKEDSYRISSLSHYLIAQSLDIVVMHYARDEIVLDHGVYAFLRCKAEDNDVSFDAVFTEIDSLFECSYGKIVYSVVLQNFSALCSAVSVCVGLDDAYHLRALHLCLDLLYVVVKSGHIDLSPDLS